MPTNYNGYTVPEPTDIADAPAAFEQFSDSIPFNEYVAIESLSADTTVVDSYNGKMIFATADLTLTFGTLTDGFSVAITADTGVTVDYLGVDKASQQSTAYQVASVVAVNSVNIISIAGASAPPCPPCPPAGTPEATITAITGSGTTHTYGSYIAYEFKTSGTITSTEGTVPEALLVGGGGSGGSVYSGGGGAGGLLQLTSPYLSAMTHYVTVGAGGIAIPSDYANVGNDGMNGEVSRLHDYYSPGGGGGGSSTFNTAGATWWFNAGNNGGSGGGASGGTSGSGNDRSGGAGTTGLGNNGGSSTGSPVTYTAAGGGGSDGVGETPTASGTGGDGGAGKATTITGTSVTLAAGGGGSATTAGAGGSGGGGDAGATIGNAGTANTGSGGGGNYNTIASSIGGDGGSGVVVVKVLATNASSVDTTGWIEVTAAMLAAAEKKRKAEVKKLEKKLALQLKSEELSGQTNKTDIKENK